MPQDELVRRDLSEEHWGEVEQGWLAGPDARRYARRTTRSTRRDADRLVEEGAPLVLFYWAGARLEWFDGVEAHAQWQAVRPDVVAGEPRGGGDVEWTAGRWEDEEGRPILVLTGHC